MSPTLRPDPPAPGPPTRRPRADAERNRARLLSAAAAAYADLEATAASAQEPSSESPGISLEQIARDAGVGIGTLYRHFPTREALVAELYRHELEELCASAAELLARRPPEAALRAWMERFRDYVTLKRSMGDSLRSAFAAGSFDLPQIRSQMAAAITPILTAGAADGSLRPDLSAADLIAAVVGMFASTRVTGGPDQLSRLLDLLVDAARPPHR